MVTNLNDWAVDDFADWRISSALADAADAWDREKDRRRGDTAS